MSSGNSPQDRAAPYPALMSIVKDRLEHWAGHMLASLSAPLSQATLSKRQAHRSDKEVVPLEGPILK